MKGLQKLQRSGNVLHRAATVAKAPQHRPSVQCHSSKSRTFWNFDMHETTPRVLSIQSTVVHGYVGNKCAVFPLQLLGFEVDPIYSVQFSNHTGYPSFKGSVFDGEHLKSLLQGLEENKIMNYTHLLTGKHSMPAHAQPMRVLALCMHPCMTSS